MYMYLILFTFMFANEWLGHLNLTLCGLQKSLLMYYCILKGKIIYSSDFFMKIFKDTLFR